MTENKKEVTAQIEDYFKHVSIETFVKYFFIFQKNRKVKSNILIYEAFEDGNEVRTKKSQASRASKCKQIFNQNKELDALNYIIYNSSRCSQKCKILAQKILNIYNASFKLQAQDNEDELYYNYGKLVNRNFYSEEDLLFRNEIQFKNFFINLLASEINVLSVKSEVILFHFAILFFEDYKIDWYFSYYDKQKYFRIKPNEIVDDLSVQEYIKMLIELNQFEIYDLYDKLNTLN